jgi:ankyrin repeat protein
MNGASRYIFWFAVVVFSCLFLWGAGYRTLFPPLHQAAIEGKLTEIEELLAQKPDILLSRDEQGNLALHHAAWNGQIAVVDYLIRAGTPVDAVVQRPGEGVDGWSSLHHAASQGQSEVIRHLIQAGATLELPARDNAVPLHHAAWNNHLDAAKTLLEFRSNPNVRRKNGVTPLESAAFFGHTDMVRLLLTYGADPNSQVYEGHTPLHQSARNGHLEVMRFLVQAKANIDAARDDGRTPLHLAAESGQVSSVSYLLAMGANLFAKDRSDKTPLAVAQGSAKAYLSDYLSALNDLESHQEARKAVNQSLPKGSVTETVIYQGNFTGERPGSEWTTTPLGAHFAELRYSPLDTNRQYLGNFGSQNVRLRLGKLPPHQQITVELDLLVLNSWDGDSIPGYGPDMWEASVTDGPLLFRTTFANSEPTFHVPIQAYPGEYPQQHHLSRTGAVAKNIAVVGGSSPPRNAVYRFKFRFAHTASHVVLNFAGKNLQELSDESWGISRIIVRTGSTKSRKPDKP